MVQAAPEQGRVEAVCGHKRIETTLGIYAHALPLMWRDAAARLGAILHGSGYARLSCTVHAGGTRVSDPFSQSCFKLLR